MSGENLLLSEASIEDISKELNRRCACLVVMYARQHEKDKEITEQDYRFFGGIHACYGLATELKHRLKRILLASEETK